MHLRHDDQGCYKYIAHATQDSYRYARPVDSLLYFDRNGRESILSWDERISSCNTGSLSSHFLRELITVYSQYDMVSRKRTLLIIYLRVYYEWAGFLFITIRMRESICIIMMILRHQDMRIV